MTAPIDDISSLPGKKVTDQEEVTIGEVQHVYAIDGDGHPMYVSVEASFGMGDKRLVLIPIARLKDEDGVLRVPYSKAHVGNTPQIDDSDAVSPECDRKLRDHYGIDRADQELRGDNKSYATLVPEDEEAKAERVEDVDSLETPDPDKRTEETQSRLEDPGSAEMRKVTADDVTAEDSGQTGRHSEEGSGEKSEEEGEDGDD